MRGLLLLGLALAAAAAAARAAPAARSVGGATTVGTVSTSGARVAFAESGTDGMFGRVSPWNTATRSLTSGV